MKSILPASIPQCKHIRTTGVRCGSPALRGNDHWYHHNAFRRQSRVVRELEDAESIQLAIRQAINWIAQGMETKRAALTLYALQIASSNLKNIHPVAWDEVVRDLDEAADSETTYAAPLLKKPNGTVNGHTNGIHQQGE